MIYLSDNDQFIMSDIFGLMFELRYQTDGSIYVTGFDYEMTFFNIDKLLQFVQNMEDFMITAKEHQTERKRQTPQEANFSPTNDSASVF